MRRLLLVTTMCCLMSACSSGAQPMPDDPITVPPQANLTVAPKALPQPPTGHIQDLETNHREVAKAYHQLASQLCRLLQFLQLGSEDCKPWMNDL